MGLLHGVENYRRLWKIQIQKNLWHPRAEVKIEAQFRRLRSYFNLEEGYLEGQSRKLGQKVSKGQFRRLWSHFNLEEGYPEGQSRKLDQNINLEDCGVTLAWKRVIQKASLEN